MPKFWLLAGHQESLWPLTAALGIKRSAKLDFASAYFFEMFTSEGQDYVRVVLRDGRENVTTTPIACDGFDSTLGCTKDSFAAFL